MEKAARRIGKRKSIRIVLGSGIGQLLELCSLQRWIISKGFLLILFHIVLLIHYILPISIISNRKYLPPSHHRMQTHELTSSPSLHLHPTTSIKLIHNPESSSTQHTI